MLFPKKKTFIHPCFLAVLLAGSVVMAWSTIVASSDTVPPGYDRHLHRPDPHLRLPSSPNWRPHRLHPGGAHCILGGTFQKLQSSRSIRPYLGLISVSYISLNIEPLALFLRLMLCGVDKQWRDDGVCGLCIFSLTCFLFLPAGLLHLLHV